MGLDVSGRVALVTGGAQGIGLATARALHARGARVALVDLDRAATEAAAAPLVVDGRRISGAAAARARRLVELLTAIEAREEQSGI